MIVERVGYFKLEDIIELVNNKNLFSIYETNKGTDILVIGKKDKTLTLYYPKKDRLPYKDVEGKKIKKCKIKFCSETDNVDLLDFSGWNNGNQIMAYKEFSIWMM